MFEYQTAISELTGPAGLQRVASTRARARSPPPATWPSCTTSARASSSRAACTRTRETLATTRAGWGTRSRRSRCATASREAPPTIGDDVCAVLVQQPNFLGAVEDLEALADAAQEAGALVIVLVRPAPARHPQAARRVRRRRRRGRGPDARQPARLRRPVVRLLRRPGGLPAPHARPHRRRDDATSTAAAASCSRCRRASSTSAARRRRPTSAPRRRSTRSPASST